MTPIPDTLIVGAGIFGLTAALELHARGHTVAVVDPGPLPHPLAASTDISKVIRMEYGTDEQYMAMVEAALPRWRAWNETLGEPLFHEVGLLALTREPMQTGNFEYESYRTLQKRGHEPERLTTEEIARRFPAWQDGGYVDGFFHAEAGYAESGRVISALAQRAEAQGVRLHLGQTVTELLEEGRRVVGVRMQDGAELRAGQLLVAAGTWTHLLVPELAPVMRSVGQPVFHLRPHQPDRFQAPHFPVWMTDIARTGWYGFPLHPREGVIKIGHHGAGQQLHPANDERRVTPEDEQRLRAMLAAHLPALADAPIVYTRRCLYCDTLDEHFWIDQHPERAGLSVAAGGSGHGFKFAPILGPLIADAVEGQPNPWLARFRWRELAPDTHGTEASRYHEAAP